MTDAQLEALLCQALHPEIPPEALTVHNRKLRKGKYMNIRKTMKHVCIAAALMAMLVTTVYAADGLNIKTLISGMNSRTCKTVEVAERRAGFEMDAAEKFSNGYSLESIQVVETKGLDQDDNVRLTYNEINITLQAPGGNILHLFAYPKNDSISATDLPPQQTMVIGETTVSYRVDHYKFVPEKYAQTEADKVWLQQPGNFMSYGSDTIEETDVAFLYWEKEGIQYTLLDSDADEPAASLFTMASELILKGK